MGAGFEPELAADVGLHRGIEVSEGADRTGDLANPHHLAGPLQPGEIAAELIVPERQLEAEGHRLGVYAVGAADHRRVAVLVGAGGDGRPQLADQPQDHIHRLHHLQGLRGVDDVRRRQAEVQPPRRRADVLGDGRGEGDDVVLGGLLDLFDAGDVEPGVLLEVDDCVGRHQAGTGHRVGSRELHFEPRLVAALLGPDAPHLGIGVTRDHASASCSGEILSPLTPPSTVRPSVPGANSCCARRATSASVTCSMASSIASSDSSGSS